MPILHVIGYLPGTGAKNMIVVNTKNVSFIVPCPGCDLVQIHCSGTFFETDRIGTNLILNSMNREVEGQLDIKMSEGYENVIDWQD